MAYFYCKRADGRETCYEVESVQKDAAERLQSLSNEDAHSAVQIVQEDDLKELEDKDDEWIGEYVDAVREGISNGMTFPISIIRSMDGEYEAVESVDYVGLCQEYDGSQYQIPPEYIESGEYTEETAVKSGRYALAELLKHNDQ